MKANKGKLLSSNTFPVVGIGASAGGLAAFKKLLKAIPENSGMAYVLVQHLSPSHESLLPEILQKITNIPVLEISDDIKVEPDHIYIIPSNKMLMANDGVLQLSPRPASDKKQRDLPIDLFFTSLAEVHQAHSIGVVLSGTASDGTLGLKAIKDHGGITFAQDEASAEYGDMPHNAVEAGVVDFILPPDKVPEKLLEITKSLNRNSDEGQSIPKDDEVFKQILSLIRIRKGTDFTYYKQTTIRRRILRRMALNKNEEPSAYLKHLRENKTEQDILYQDLLIPVTAFFRDRKTFENLSETVFPLIVKNKIAMAIGTEPIRIWVAGCSTGEEAYSIAICFKEFLGDKQEKVQIFATDISEPAIVKARTGIYTKSEVEGVAPQRLQEFFTKTNGSYHVNKEVRDMCVFAVHNFLKDPPFGKMDFISCRNVLIYMDPYLQKKALTTFHYALNPRLNDSVGQAKGFLLLGKSETSSSVPDLFASAGKSDKLFSRKDVPGRFMHVASQGSEQNFRDQNLNHRTENLRTDFQKTADDIILNKYSPSGVIVNEAMDIVHLRGNNSAWLELSPGKPSLNLLKMAKSGLAFELRNILHKAKKENKAVRKENIPLKINGSQGLAAFEVIPLPDTEETFYLILLHDTITSANNPPEKINKKTGKIKNSDKDLRIAELEQELATIREDMRGITEEQEAANEELQSANEELQSGSEELQSLNEELETSKEELQSTNEELTVVNQQMIGLNEQVTEERNYSQAIVATVREPLLVLDKNLKVKTANSSFYKTFQVNVRETEGRLIYDLGNKQWNIPQLRTLLEATLPEKESFVDFEVDHNFPSIGHRTMLLNAHEINREKGSEKFILLAIEDITERKKAEQERSMLSSIVASSNDAIISKTLEGIITSWNKGAEKIFGYSPQEAVGKHITLLIPPELQHEEEMVIGKVKKGQQVLHFETVRLAKNGRRINISLTLSPISDNTGKIIGASKIARDITERIRAEEVLKNNEEHFRRLVKDLPAGVYSCDAQGHINFYNNAAVKLWGREPELGKEQWCGSWKMIALDGSPLPADVFPMAIAFNEGRTIMGEEIFIEREDGTRSTVQVYSQPVFSLSGKITGAINMVIDVTEQKEALRKIEESEKRFSNMLMQSPFAFGILKGKDMVVRLANDAIKEVWGKGTDLEGKKMLDILPEIKDQGFPELLQSVYTTGVPYYGHETLVKLQRKGIWEDVYFNFVYQAYKEVDGNISGVVIIANEVTSQAESNRRIRESELQLHRMADLMPEKIWTADGEGNMNYFNQTWLTYTGLAFEELEGWGWKKIIHIDDWKENQRRWQQSINTGNPFEYEHRFLNKEGEYKWHLSRGLPLRADSGKIIMWIGSNTEIQQQKNQRAELEKAVINRTYEIQQANEELQQKNQEIAQKNEALVKLNKELESFSYISSHDLQEPLRKIQTFATRIMEKEYDALTEKGKNYFHRMQNSAMRMQTLIQDLLSYSRTTNAERKFEITDLNKVVEEVKNDFKEMIHEQKATIEAHDLCEANVIPFQFHQMIYNLIGNSLKYSNPEKPPYITIKSEIAKGSTFKNEALSRDKDYCHISISDNGIGFDPQYKDKIFEVFQRLYGKDEYPGTGIGLSIVKRIVDNHNGFITAKGELNKEQLLIFIFRLPDACQEGSMN